MTASTSAAAPAGTRDFIRPALAVLSLVGAGIAGYLWISENAGTPACFGLGDCATVYSSPYSHLFGQPVAAFGLATYVVLLILVIAWSRLSLDSVSILGIAVFAVGSAGLGFSAWLTYVEFFVIHAFCPWCLTSGAIIAVIFAVTLRELLRKRPA
jgi:uncharacterized membrane protein